jgi:hypothetical protein
MIRRLCVVSGLVVTTMSAVPAPSLAQCRRVEFRAEAIARRAERLAERAGRRAVLAERIAVRRVARAEAMTARRIARAAARADWVRRPYLDWRY